MQELEQEPAWGLEQGQGQGRALERVQGLEGVPGLEQERVPEQKQGQGRVLEQGQVPELELVEEPGLEEPGLGLEQVPAQALARELGLVLDLVLEVGVGYGDRSWGWRPRRAGYASGDHINLSVLWGDNKGEI